MKKARDRACLIRYSLFVIRHSCVPHPSRERYHEHRTHMRARDGAPAAANGGGVAMATLAGSTGNIAAVTGRADTAVSHGASPPVGNRRHTLAAKIPVADWLGRGGEAFVS